MLDYAKSDPEAMPMMRDIFVKNMDWPGAQQLAERLKKSIPPQLLSDAERRALQDEPQPQQAPDPQVLLQQQRLQLDAQNQQAKLQLEQQKAAHEMQLEERRLQLDAHLALNAPKSNGANGGAVVIAGADAGDIGSAVAESVSLGNTELVQSVGAGLAQLGQSVAAGTAALVQGLAGAVSQMGEQLAAQVGAQLAVQAQAVAGLGQEMADAVRAAAEASNAPKTIELKRNSRGELVGATTTVDDDE
jgi:hypothetical protein